MTTGVPLYLVTACSSPEEFVAAFRRYTDRTGLFVPCALPLPAGKRGRIAVTLRDGGVMIEGEAEIVASSPKPSALYGRMGMTIRFVEPDEPSKTLLGELERARIALKPVAPTVAPRASDVPAEPRPIAPKPGGRIDAANALAETVTIGDVTLLRDGGGTSVPVLPALPSLGAADSGKVPGASPPPKAAQKFVMPTIPSKASTTKPPPISDLRPAITPMTVPIIAPKPLPLAEPPRPLSIAEPPKPIAEAPKPPPPKPSPVTLAPPKPVSVTVTQPSAVVPMPMRPPATPPARPKPVFVPPEPEENTDMTAAPEEPSDAVPRAAPYETRKTSLGISAVVVTPALLEDRPRAPAPARAPKLTEPPAPAGPRDTELMLAEPGGVVGPASVDAHAPTLQPGVLDVDILQAASGLEGDWTMAPDAVAPVPLVAPTPPAPPERMTGDWIISTDAEAEDGWSAPSKVMKRQLTNTGVGPPMLEVASSEPLSSEPKSEPVREDTGPKVQIDPTLIEALPDLARLTASASGGFLPAGPVSSPLIAPPPPPDAQLFAQDGLAMQPMQMQPMPEIGMPMQMHTPLPGLLPMQPNYQQPPLGPPMDGGAVEMGMMQPQGMPPPTGMFGMSPEMAMTPPGMTAPGMGLPPPNMFGTGPEMAIPSVDVYGRPTPPPGSYSAPIPGAYPTPVPGFAPPVGQPGGYAPMMDPAQLVGMPTPEQLVVGDSTAVLDGGRRRRLIVIVALVLLAVALGVYLVLTTGGGKHGSDAPAAPADGSGIASSAAAKPGSDAGLASDHAPLGSAGTQAPATDAGGTTPIPAAMADARIAAAPAPTADAGSAAVAPSDATTCSVKLITAPAGADVLIDTAVVAKTPGTVEVPCNVEVKLVFRKGNLVPQYRAITPKPGVDTVVRVALGKLVVSLKISSKPAGAAISINGKAQGVTPSNVKVNAFEPATIVMTKAGFDSYTETITPKANAETVHGVLKRKK